MIDLKFDRGPWGTMTTLAELVGCCGCAVIDRFDRNPETVKASTEELLKKSSYMADVTYLGNKRDLKLDEQGNPKEDVRKERTRGLILWACSPKLGPVPLDAYYAAGWECWGIWNSQYDQTPMYLMALSVKKWTKDRVENGKVVPNDPSPDA